MLKRWWSNILGIFSALLLFTGSFVVFYHQKNQTNFNTTNHAVTNSQAVQPTSEHLTVGDYWNVNKAEFIALGVLVNGKQALANVPDDAIFVLFGGGEPGPEVKTPDPRFDFHNIKNINGGKVVDPIFAPYVTKNGINYRLEAVSGPAFQYFVGKTVFKSATMVRIDTGSASGYAAAQVTRIEYHLVNSPITNFGINDVLFFSNWDFLTAAPEANPLMDNLQEIAIYDEQNQFDFANLRVGNRFFADKRNLSKIQYFRPKGSNHHLNIYAYLRSFLMDVSKPIYRNNFTIHGYDINSQGTAELNDEGLVYTHVGGQAFRMSGLSNDLDLSNSPANIFDPTPNFSEEATVMYDEFQKNNFHHVILPPQLTYLPKWSFQSCVNLESITYPRSLIDWRGNSMSLNYRLSSVYFSYSLEELEQVEAVGESFEQAPNQSIERKVYLGYDPFTTTYQKIRNAYLDKLSGYSLTKNWRFNFPVTSPYALTNKTGFDTINLKGDDEDRKAGRIVYTIDPYFTNYLKQNPDVSLTVTPWTQGEQQGIQIGSSRLSRDKTELTIELSLTKQHKNNVNLDFVPSVKLVRNSTLSVDTLSLPTCHVNILKSSNDVLASQVNYNTPSHTTGTNGLWLKGDEASFTLNVPLALVDNERSALNFMQHWHSYLAWDFRNVIPGDITETAQVPDRIYLKNRNGQIDGYLLVQEADPTDNYHAAFRFTLHYGSDQVNDSNWQSGDITFRIKGSSSSTPQAAIHVFAKTELDPNNYNAIATVDHYNLSLNQPTKISYAIPVNNSNLGYNSYKWWSQKGVEPTVVAPTLNDPNDLVALSDWTFNDDYTELSAIVTVKKQISSDQTISLTGGGISLNHETKSTLANLTLTVSAASGIVETTDVTYTDSPLVNHAQNPGLWIKGDQASFSATLNKYLLNNPDQIDLDGLNQYFDFYLGDQKIRFDLVSDPNGHYYQYEDILKLNFALAPIQPQNNPHMVKLNLNFTMLDHAGLNNDNLSVRLHTNNDLVKQITTYAPDQLNPKQTNINELPSFQLNANKTTAEVEWTIASIPNVTGITKNTYQWLANHHNTLSFVYPNNQDYVANDQLKLTNLQFNGDYTKIVGHVELLQDQLSEKISVLNLSKVKIVDQNNKTIKTGIPNITTNIDPDSQVVNVHELTYDYSTSIFPNHQGEGLWINNDIVHLSFDIADAVVNNLTIDQLASQFNNFIYSNYQNRLVEWRYDQAQNTYNAYDENLQLPFSFTLNISDYLPHGFNVRTYTLNIQMNDTVNTDGQLRLGIINNRHLYSELVPINVYGYNAINPNYTESEPDAKLIELSENKTKATFGLNLLTKELRHQQINSFIYLLNLGHELTLSAKNTDFYHINDLQLNIDGTRLTGNIVLDQVNEMNNDFTLEIQVLDHTNKDVVVTTFNNIHVSVLKGDSTVNYEDPTYNDPSEQELKQEGNWVSFVIDVPNVLTPNDLIDHLDIRYQEGNDTNKWTWTRKSKNENIYFSSNNQYQLSYKKLFTGLNSRSSYRITIKQIVAWSLQNTIRVSVINQDASSHILQIKTAKYGHSPFDPTHSDLPLILYSSIGGGIGLLIVLFILYRAISKYRANKRAFYSF